VKPATLVLLAALAVSLSAQTSSLKIGRGSSVITPFLDQPMAGYYYPRSAEGVHDDLYAKAVAFDDGFQEIVLVACDTVSVARGAVEEARRRIEKQLGIPPSHVLISATHSHTGPDFTPEYETFLARRIADAVTTAHRNKTVARLSVANDSEPSLPHYRRYWMKDGTVVTNPGFLNPAIVKPAGTIDPRVPVLYAEDLQGAPLLTWVNYSMHLDTVGGTWISADYPYFLARLLAKVKGPDMLTVFTIGAAGNINHWDVARPGPQRGLGEAQRLGEVLSAAVIRAYTHLERAEAPRVAALSSTIRIPIQKPSAEEIAEAKKIVATPPDPSVDFTLDRVKAVKVMQVVDRKGEDLSPEVQVLSVGPVAFVGIPGELFVELGLEIQKKSPFKNTVIVELADQDIGYIPTEDGFRQGAYEPTSTLMVPGSGERIAAKAIELLGELKKSADRPR
jgi:neutral ceramidase